MDLIKALNEKQLKEVPQVQVGDTVIIIAYALMDFEEAKTFQPTVIFPKEGNKL